MYDMKEVSLLVSSKMILCRDRRSEKAGIEAREWNVEKSFASQNTTSCDTMGIFPVTNLVRPENSKHGQHDSMKADEDART